MRQRSVAAIVSALLCCAVLGMTACEESGTAGNQATATALASGGKGAQLSCMFHERPQEADTVSVTIACQVSAAVSDTAFTVRHMVAGPKGQGTVQDATCSGTLYNGAGGCSVTVTEQSTTASPGMVQGELLPSNAVLGPVAPGIIP